MPAPIVGGILGYLEQKLGCYVWRGEVPRYDTAGRPIYPDSTATDPSNWPVVKCFMTEAGFARNPTTEDPYDDQGGVVVQMWGTSQDEVDVLLNEVEGALNSVSGWQQISLPGGPPANPYYVIAILIDSWYSGQEEGVRLAKSQLAFRAELHCTVMVHGALSSA